MRLGGARKRMATAIVIAVGVGALAGCGGQTPDIETATANQLQSSVVAIAERAAAGDAAGALSRLNALQSAVQADTAKGSITSERSARIRAAITRVRADLSAAHSAPPTAAPSPRSPSDSDSSPSPSSAPVPTTGGAGGGAGGSTGGATPPPPTTTSSPSDNPTVAPTDPPPSTGGTTAP